MEPRDLQSGLLERRPRRRRPPWLRRGRCGLSVNENSAEPSRPEPSVWIRRGEGRPPRWRATSAAAIENADRRRHIAGASAGGRTGGFDRGRVRALYQGRFVDRLELRGRDRLQLAQQAIGPGRVFRAAEEPVAAV